jgi:hypothetical protein
MDKKAEIERICKELATVLTAQDPTKVAIPDMVMALAATLAATGRSLMDVGYRKEGADRVELHRKRLLHQLDQIREDWETHQARGDEKAKELEEVLVP